MQQLISVEFKADFGFFRKPDANNTINLSYNILHKPALLGILGAIIGLEGYQEKGQMPAYYNALSTIKVGIEPLGHEKGAFQKTVIKYTNTVGYANNGSNYLTEEATLIKPAYRVYLLLDTDDANQHKLYEYLRDGKAEYLPYFGKNEFSAWWDTTTFKEYINFEANSKPTASIELKTIFTKSDIIKKHKEEPIPDIFSMDKEIIPFLYFERLPKGFDTNLFQYEMSDCVFSSYNIKNSMSLDNLFFLKNENYYVQLV